MMAFGYFNLHLASGYMYIIYIYEYPIATIHLLDIFSVALNLQKPHHSQPSGGPWQCLQKALGFRPASAPVEPMAAMETILDTPKGMGGSMFTVYHQWYISYII